MTLLLFGSCGAVINRLCSDKETAHIINGHIPVKQTKGESPIKANGKMIVIDGGMSKPYQKVTGIAGYTLTYHSYGMGLAAHEPFLGKDEIVVNDRELMTVKYVVSRYKDRITVGQTDIGERLKEQIADLTTLAYLYQEGIIKERG